MARTKITGRKGAALPAIPADAVGAILLRLDGHVPTLCAAACVSTCWCAVVTGTPALWRWIVIDPPRRVLTGWRPQPTPKKERGWFVKPRTGCTVNGEQLARLVALSAGGVVRLTLNWCHNLDNEALCAALALAPHLETLSLVGCKQLTVSGVASALTGRKLKLLSVDGILDDVGNGTEIEAMNLLGPALLDDDGDGLDVINVCQQRVPVEHPTDATATRPCRRLNCSDFGESYGCECFGNPAPKCDWCLREIFELTGETAVLCGCFCPKCGVFWKDGSLQSFWDFYHCKFCGKWVCIDCGDETTQCCRSDATPPCYSSVCAECAEEGRSCANLCCELSGFFCKDCVRFMDGGSCDSCPKSFCWDQCGNGYLNYCNDCHACHCNECAVERMQYALPDGRVIPFALPSDTAALADFDTEHYGNLCCSKCVTKRGEAAATK